ncbi:sensor histidine kinase [Streptomyces fuscichromogenes]|uniref:Histidine kinase n=1 Tax=Streptomyces fuscichromogenes TaxID=1324013 RepID=A0A918CQQ0_9ACTN|nr:histidine kinase [Streptomyces fuscichromogenes]GGN02370.1 histidine kinase [Streptomyces fuscichromogenes]
MSAAAGGWWRGKSTPAKIETYTRWSFHFFAVVEVAAIGLPVLAQAGADVAGWMTAMVVGHALLCAVTASRALDWTRGRREQPVRLLWVLGAATCVLAVVALALRRHGGPDDGTENAAGTVFAMILAFGAGTMALGVRNRRRVAAQTTGFAFGAAVLSLPLGVPGPEAVVTACVVLLSGSFLAATSIFSVWLLNAVYELDEARETRARLAVAEERLRFGRDLHDVLGRNLAVIALKSELAVQLARRERPEAVEQMIEVQRIAQESQREVRDVVRGYREADLSAELAGAQGVLTAAGISCELSGDTAGLPAEVQSALGWVVREATTNVLRHGDASRCSVGLRVREGQVVLTVENDGVAVRGSGPGQERGGSGGSGLAGLRERLAVVDGALEAGPAGPDGFRVVASVPLSGRTADAKVSGVTS